MATAPPTAARPQSAPQTAAPQSPPQTAAPARTLASTRAATAATEVCPSCAGTGWADPWEVGDGAPELTSCDRCLGAGLDGCPDCDGEGSLAVPVACPCQRAAAA